MEQRIFRLRALLGVPAAALPPLPRADQGKDRIGSEVHPTKLLVRTAGTRAGQLRRYERAVARMGRDSGESESARHDAGTGFTALGWRSVQHATRGGPSSVSV